MRYVVELNDENGKHFQIELHVPFISGDSNPSNSTWRALEGGFIKFHSGGCRAGKGGELIPKPTSLLLASGSTMVAVLDDVFDRLGFVNSSGSGIIGFGCQLNFTSRFNWTLIS